MSSSMEVLALVAVFVIGVCVIIKRPFRKPEPTEEQRRAARINYITSAADVSDDYAERIVSQLESPGGQRGQ